MRVIGWVTVVGSDDLPLEIYPDNTNLTNLNNSMLNETETQEMEIDTETLQEGTFFITKDGRLVTEDEKINESKKSEDEYTKLETTRAQNRIKTIIATKEETFEKSHSY